MISKICDLNFADMSELCDAHTYTIHDPIWVLDWLRAWDGKRSDDISRVYV